jgi:hypothetical protein
MAEYLQQTSWPAKKNVRFLSMLFLMQEKQESNKQALDHFFRARQTALVTAVCTAKVRAFRLQQVLTRQVT